MRCPVPLLILLFLAACDGPAAVATVGVNVASITVFGRAVPDLLVSGVTGRDCSVVRLDRGLSYCEAQAPAPGPPPYCTRSRGSVDCWVTRPPSIPMQEGVVNGPVTLTPAQEQDRTARWPDL
ncbi:hypothetical protein [Roseococcus sp. YIM B11640]|uniref:hypothetical protein n=1 Tax=Roseococcus sp. YIM B11640 TaxID=3133973 RepID=UPI003C7EC9C3